MPAPLGHGVRENVGAGMRWWVGQEGRSRWVGDHPRRRDNGAAERCETRTSDDSEVAGDMAESPLDMASARVLVYSHIAVVSQARLKTPLMRNEST